MCAPTGSGKTVVGEYAVDLALEKGTRCFYTTPIKALSNQKFGDLVEVYGPARVGLLTGDRAINPDADVVVMTTEVLRNMIYAASPALTRLSHVVMDEIHYLADASRGAVWEEVILNLDESVKIIGLSATVSNAEEFGDWLTTVRGDTEVIVSEHRPVPLHQWMLVDRQILPLFEPGDAGPEGSGGRVSKALSRAIERLEQRSGNGHEGGSTWSWAHSGATDQPGPKSGPRGAGRGGFRARSRGGDRPRDGWGHNAIRSASPGSRRQSGQISRPEVIARLRDHGMLPAITFIFSRAGCDAAQWQCLRSHLVLTDQDEAQEIKRIVDEAVAGIPDEDLEVLQFTKWRAGLMRGFAAHHAGMLPAFRLVVEELFQRGLVRAVFATETLALGINMPARTVVLEKLTKFNGQTHAELTPAEYTQLTGRAGRRGIDSLGHAVVHWSPQVDAAEVAGLASTRTYPLVSTFSPGFNMAVNLLGTLGYARAVDLLESSFAQFQANKSVVDDARRLERAKAAADELAADLNAQFARVAGGVLAPAGDADMLMDYLTVRRRLSEAEKEAQRAARFERDKEIRRLLASAQRGDVLALPAKKRPLLAVVVSAANQSEDPRPQVISEAGWVGRLSGEDFANTPIVLGHLRLPRGAAANPKRHAKYVREQFRRNQFGRPKKLKLRARVRPTEEVTRLRAEVHHHPVHAWPKDVREHLARTGERLIRARLEVQRYATRIDQSTDTLARTFERILQLLSELDYVEHTDSGAWRVTEEGTRLARIHNEQDLLVAQCLKRGVWDGLDPAELAGAASLCAFENRRETAGNAQAPTDDLARAVDQTWRIYRELAADEERYRLPITREPDGAFALAIHQWTAGAPLDYVLEAAAASGAQLNAGDFVRWSRRVVDVLEQVSVTGYSDEICRKARQAIGAIQRGVVTAGA